jgi:hypothetical protein
VTDLAEKEKIIKWSEEMVKNEGTRRVGLQRKRERREYTQEENTKLEKNTLCRERRERMGERGRKR